MRHLSRDEQAMTDAARAEVHTVLVMPGRWRCSYLTVHGGDDRTILRDRASRWRYSEERNPIGKHGHGGRTFQRDR